MTPTRRTSPITDAIYPRGRKQRKPSPPKRDVNPRHGFGLAGQLDAETRRKLEALSGKLEGQQRRGRRRKGAK